MLSLSQHEIAGLRGCAQSHRPLRPTNHACPFRPVRLPVRVASANHYYSKQRLQLQCSAISSRQPHLQRQRLRIVATTPQPGVEEAPSTAPQEWETPTPSRRPDIFPEFEKLKTVLPKPLPGDPELPDEEAEEQAHRGPEPGDPEPEEEGEEGEKEPEKEVEEQPNRNVPERPKPDLPKIPD